MVYPPKEEEVAEQRKLSDAQKAEIKSIFVLYDANNNGLLRRRSCSRRSPRAGRRRGDRGDVRGVRPTGRT